MEEQTATNKSGVKTGVVIALVVIIAVIFGGLGYVFGKRAEQKAADKMAVTTDETTATATASKSASATVSATTPAAVETASWEMYANDTYGFSFKYPADWGQPTLETQGPLSEPIEVTGYSHEISFENQPAEPARIGFSTSDFSAPRGSRFWEGIKGTKSNNCEEVKSNIGYMSFCEEVVSQYNHKAFMVDDSAFGNYIYAGIIYSNNPTYPVFGVVPYGNKSDEATQKLIRGLLSTFQFTK